MFATVSSSPPTRRVSATLFYGDSLITPAISVLGAMEGLELAAPGLGPCVVPASLLILVGLFLVQRFGTAVVGRFIGPVIVLWFLMLGAMGIVHIARQPQILAALNPLHVGTSWPSATGSCLPRSVPSPLGHDFRRVMLNFAFMDTPDLPAALTLAAARGPNIAVFETSCFLSRGTVVSAPVHAPARTMVA